MTHSDIALLTLSSYTWLYITLMAYSTRLASTQQAYSITNSTKNNSQTEL